MRPPARAAWAPEHIDRPGHDPATLAQSLRHVEQANDWFGGTRSLRLALAPLLVPGVTRTLLDVGTGSGGVARGLARWAERRGTPLLIMGLDLHAGALHIAQQAARSTPAAGPAASLPLVRADTLALPFRDAAFDLVTATLMLHHLPDPLQVPALREMGRVARHAVVVAELERSRVHYAGARLLSSTLWRSNPLTRHDGPVSVLRGYTVPELLDTARAAGLPARTWRRPFYRLVLVAGRADRAAAASDA